MPVYRQKILQTGFYNNFSRFTEIGSQYVDSLRALLGVVHGESEVVFTQAANAEHLRSAVAAADVHAGLLREHVFHVHHGVFIDRLAALDAASGAAGRDLHGIERVAGGAFLDRKSTV